MEFANKTNSEKQVESAPSPSTLSLEELLAEIQEILEKARSDEPYDAARLDALFAAQEAHADYRAQQENEYEAWRDSIEEFCVESLETMRSFVPPNIFSANFDKLVQEYHLPDDIARRILSRQCLWLTRMTTEEIKRLHDADLNNRYNVTSQTLDVVEVAAIYYSLPDRFINDRTGKKIEWREGIEKHLRDLLEEKDAEVLAKHLVRNPVYTGLIRGPVTDLTTMKPFEITATSAGSAGPRKSFSEVCKQHSLLGKLNKRRSLQEEAAAAHTALTEEA